MNSENDIATHWFYGDGFITMMEFKDGKCWAQGKYLETKWRKIRKEENKMNFGMFDWIKLMFEDKGKMGVNGNTANTSVLPLQNS